MRAWGWRVLGVLAALAVAVWWGYASGKAEWGFVGFPGYPFGQRPPDGVEAAVVLFAAGAAFGIPAVLIPFVATIVWYLVARSGPDCTAEYIRTHTEGCGAEVVLFVGSLGFIPVAAGVAAKAGARWFLTRQRRVRRAPPTAE
jgi:hypothetical protein